MIWFVFRFGSILPITVRMTWMTSGQSNCSANDAALRTPISVTPRQCKTMQNMPVVSGPQCSKCIGAHFSYGADQRRTLIDAGSPTQRHCPHDATGSRLGRPAQSGLGWWPHLGCFSVLRSESLRGRPVLQLWMPQCEWDRWYLPEQGVITNLGGSMSACDDWLGKIE